jgi:hypothetical protein
MLTDEKTKKARGMAFVEVHDDPEILHPQAPSNFFEGPSHQYWAVDGGQKEQRIAQVEN